MQAWEGAWRLLSGPLLTAAAVAAIEWYFHRGRGRLRVDRRTESAGESRRPIPSASAMTPQPAGWLGASWDNLHQLSPEEQTLWLSTRMQDWSRFVRDIQESDAQLEAHRATGNSGPPPGSLTLGEYRQKRALRTQA